MRLDHRNRAHFELPGISGYKPPLKNFPDPETQSRGGGVYKVFGAINVFTNPPLPNIFQNLFQNHKNFSGGFAPGPPYYNKKHVFTTVILIS